MAFTYDENGTSDRDKVRRLVSDTVEATSMVGDEIIDMWLTLKSNIYEAAAAVADVIALGYAKQADISLGPLSVSYSTQSSGYSQLAANLRAGLNSNTVFRPQTADGVLDKEPEFKIGMHNNPSGADPRYQTGE